MKKVLWYVTWRNKEYLWFLESDYKSLFVITSVCLDMNTSEWLNFRILNIEHFAKIAKIYSEPIKWLNFRHNSWPIKLGKYYFECISSIQRSSKNHTEWNLAVFNKKFVWKLRKSTRNRSNDSFSGIFFVHYIFEFDWSIQRCSKNYTKWQLAVFHTTFYKIAKTLGTLSRVPL